MGTEIYRARAIEGGRIRFEVECDNLAHFAAVANAAMAVVPEAYAPREATAPPVAFSHAEAVFIAGGERRVQHLVPRPIPRAHVWPYSTPEDTTLGGQPLSGDELKAGGTD